MNHTSKLVNGVFDNSFAAGAAHPDFELHSLQSNLKLIAKLKLSFGPDKYL